MSDYEQEIYDLTYTFKQIYKMPVMQQFIMNAYGEMAVLSALKVAPNNLLLPSEIGRAAGLTPTRVAAILKSLEKKDLISREIDLTDRRKIQVKIKAAGLVKQEEERERTYQFMEKIFLSLGADEVQKLISSMKSFEKVASELTVPLQEENKK